MSVETMKLVADLPPLEEGKPAKAKATAEGYSQADLDAGHIYVAEEAASEGETAATEKS